LPQQWQTSGAKTYIMSFSSKAFLSDREAIATGLYLYPITTGYRRQQETSMAARNKYFNQLTDADREQMRLEADYEQKKNDYRL